MIKMQLNYHDFLEVHASKRLKAYGYDVFFEIPLKNGGIIDVFGSNKKRHKIGIECLVNPNDKIVNKKVKQYSKYFKKLIIAIFDDVNYKNKNINIWRFPRTLIFKNSSILYEYICNSCQKIFYGDAHANNCPYCLCNNIKVYFKDYIKTERFIDIPNKFVYKKKKYFIILKKPGFIEIINKNGK